MGARAPMAVPDRRNARWSLDCVQDQITDGKRFSILWVVDDCAQERLALVPNRPISGLRVAGTIDAMAERSGPTAAIVSDNGTELSSNATLTQSDEQSVACEAIQPGKPAQNAFAESGHVRLRDALLNQTRSHSLRHAREVLDAWRDQDDLERARRLGARKTTWSAQEDLERPHSSLGWTTAAENAAERRFGDSAKYRRIPDLAG